MDAHAAPRAAAADVAPPAGRAIRVGAPARPAGAAALDAALLEAHGRGDGPALVRLYLAAADRAEAEDRVEAACFYLTHAYVFALEAGDPLADTLHARLRARGREE